MANVVCLHKPIEGGDKWCSIVGDNFFESSPAAEDLFKDECTQGASCFSVEHTKFGPG